MNNELISVIVPVFNTERYLAACLDSILAQSYQNLEIIVVNDGSTDLSLNVAESYAEKDDRIRLYNHDNEGLSEARNRGLNVSTGEIVTFVDSDDILLPGALKKMMKAMDETGADIVEGMSIKTHASFKLENLDDPVIIEYEASAAIEDVLYQKRLLPSACGKLFKKSLFENINFRKNIYYEDLDVFYKLFEKAHKIVYLKYPVYFYRETEGSITNTWNPKRLDVLNVTENIENYFIGNDILLKPARDRRLSANFNMFSLCSLNGDKENADKCWEIIKKYRRQSLTDPKVRIKNKAGILLSFLGKNLFKLVSRKVYK